MTWVSPEPWGYVTYHHGRWGWTASIGWFWIPGVYYAPAWVAWQSDDAYFGWAPLGYDNAPRPLGLRRLARRDLLERRGHPDRLLRPRP